MSKTESSAVVVPTTEGKPEMAQAAGVTKMKGGALVLTPLPLSGGRRKTRKISKKVLKTLKKMGTKKVMKMLKKGGQAEESMATEEPAPTMGARRRSSRKASSRRGMFHY
jgi:alpha/beta superfamily hydrolase